MYSGTNLRCAKSSAEMRNKDGKIKILVVDDESRMRKLVRDFLVREDYEVLEAGDGEAALDILSGKNIALIILDVMMPKMNGWEVCRKSGDFESANYHADGEGDEEDELTGFELELMSISQNRFLRRS